MEVTCNFDGTQNEVLDCQKKHGEYSNRVQQTSMKALKKLMSTTIERTPLGIIINGDLTEYGHDDELARFNQQWSNWTEFKIYPGLGNHDYSNNVDNCVFQRCANRMLKFFQSYVKDTLKINIDIRGKTRNLVQQIFTGSLAYSWDECPTTPSSNECFHFVQLNNYPTYAKNIDSPFTEWKILPSLNFLKHDLQANVGKSTIINFHDIDSGYDKSTFMNVLRSINNSTTILGIFFAHYHDRHGVRNYWCINGKTVPLLYTGSVPANNYLLVHFSSELKAIKTVYKIHAADDYLSNVDEIYFQKIC